MSSGLFDENVSKKGNYTIVIVAIAAFIILGGTGYGLYRYSAPPPKDVSKIAEQEIRESMIFMLAQPSFTGQEFREQLLGKATISKYAWRDKQVYFTFPESSEEEFGEFVKEYIIDESKIDFGKTEAGRIKLDSYTLRISPYAAKFFKTNTNNFKLNTDQSLTFPYATVSYTASLNELKNLANSSQLYGGQLITRAPSRRDEPQYVFANHGIMVAKPEEPSLKRLAETLLSEVGAGREERIQRLVDFVSNEIEYSYTEAVAPSEKLKRASETLMTRNGDCSNKTILLASLLEQIGEEYLLLYSPRHITVAVPQGNYVNDNGLDFTWENKQWLIAETTLAGFQIGFTQVKEARLLTKVNYVQTPRLTDLIFDANSFETLKFF
ncbi:MAG: transglutaminase domain-containing protein [Acidobacteria bacterium]|nr:transglutaminase domain-containing protein [Acidobacteriota bacterium]